MLLTTTHKPISPSEFFETSSIRTKMPSHPLAIFAIKSIHTAIFAVNSTSVLYVFVTGVRGRSTRWTLPASLIVLAEGAVFFGNHWRCPLTQLTEKLGAAKGQVTDIFLPHWFAQRIPQIYTPLFIIGLASLLWHQWRGRKRTSASSRL